jgi:hypothetical protein
MAENVIRLPKDVAEASLYNPAFRRLGCVLRLRGEWKMRVEDGSLFFEIRDPLPADAKEFMEHVQRVAGHLQSPAT